MIQTETRSDLRLSRLVYRLRLLGMLTGCVAVGAVLYERQASWALWALLAVDTLAWPHLAWLAARRSADPHLTERRSLTIDSAWGGFWVAMIHFNLLPSILIITMMSMDKLGWGAAFLARTSAAMVLAMTAGAILTRGAFAPATDMRVVVACLPLLVAYPIAVALALERAGRLARERKKALEQSAALREQLTHIARVGTLGEMAAGLAHELNQPLTAMHFEATAVLETPGAPPAVMREALATIAEQSLRAGEIVRRMRTFARRSDARRERTDLRPVIEEVLALLAHDLRLNGVTTAESLEEVPAVFIDRIEVQQVLVNLIRNAIEAMANTAMRDRRLTIDMRNANRRVRVSVGDSGPGIDPDIAPRLFHPFQTTKASGLGLGLSICQSLIEAHGGRMGTSHQQGPGAVFYFELPAAAEAR